MLAIVLRALEVLALAALLVAILAGVSDRVIILLLSLACAVLFASHAADRRGDQ